VKVEVNLLKKIVEEADDVYEFAKSMAREDEESYDVDAELQKLVDKYMNEILVKGKKNVIQKNVRNWITSHQFQKHQRALQEDQLDHQIERALMIHQVGVK
jgi:hypothetical protein